MAQTGQFENQEQLEASEQLVYIENMIREGRRTTEYWGWSLVLWGTAYLLATAWTNLPLAGRSALWAWPVTMSLAGFLTWRIAATKKRGKPVTVRTRALSTVWITAGFGIMLFAFPTVIAGRYGDGHTFTATIEILLGVAQIASGIILRWRAEILVGALWWVASMVTTFTHTDLGVAVPFIAATLICLIGFGTYLMVREARDTDALRAGQVAHA